MKTEIKNQIFKKLKIKSDRGKCLEGCSHLGACSPSGTHLSFTFCTLFEQFITPPGHACSGCRELQAIQTRGARNSKLNADNVREIRKAHAAGASISDLSAQYGVVGLTITNVIKRLTWRNVKDES